MHEEVSPVSLSKAVNYYQLGKSLNDAKCMWRLTQLYISGEILKRDVDAALIVFVDTALKGCKESKKELNKLCADIAKEDLTKQNHHAISNHYRGTECVNALKQMEHQP